MIPKVITVGGVSLYLYGLLVGLGMVAALVLIHKRAAREKISESCLNQAAMLSLLLGLVGARLWHVVTDFHLYQRDFSGVLRVAEGGWSIIGGIVGGVAGLWLGSKRAKCQHISFWQLGDIAVFGLPFGQAIGRWGNYVNQELYGLPTQLPWGVAVSPEARLPGYEASTHFHPLFLYESLAMLVFGWWIWRRSWQVGSGSYMLAYVLFYSALRFGLDFLRLDKTLWWGTGVGINQVVLVVIFITVLYVWMRRKNDGTFTKIN